MMRKGYLALVLMTGLALASTHAQAGEWYFGGKLAYFELDTPGVDDPDNAGLVVGHEWSVRHGALGIEGEYTATFEDGSAGVQKVELDTAGLYGVYRTRTPSSTGIGPYLKLKAGVSYLDLTIGSLSEDDTNFSAGATLGLNMGPVSFELEFTQIDDEIDMISLLVRF